MSIQGILDVIFELNNQDPRKERDEVGIEIGQEALFSRRVVAWIKLLDPHASDELLIAGQGVHLGRWEVPRESYPVGLQGYYQWKEGLLKIHIEKVSEQMKLFGFSEEKIQLVSKIMSRKSIKKDQDCQILEDAVALVFLEHQLEPLIDKTSGDKVVNALKKTWTKMSETGHKFALSLSYSARAEKLIKEALA